MASLKETIRAPLDSLAEVRGRVITANDPMYDQARTVFYGGIDKRPSAIVRVADIADIRRVIATARDEGYELAVRSGGHSISGHSSTDGGLVIDLRSMSKVEIDLNPLMRKRLTFTGSTLRARSVAEKGAVAAAVRRNVWPLVESGKVKPVIHATFPLAEAAKAHAMMEADQHIGKIVLTTG